MNSAKEFIGANRGTAVERRENFQTIAWFNDLRKRDMLDLDPPYQRRSVWNQAFKDYFIDTVLLNYPAPAIFVYEDIDEAGSTTYHVVDGKQRLTTIFEFLEDEFPVSEKATHTELRGRYFSDLDADRKRAFYGYRFLVEYLHSDAEAAINDVFDRINRNTAKLTRQELRHARLSGRFIEAATRAAEEIKDMLPARFPNITASSRAQMKDVEQASTLLLLIEEGVGSYSQDDLDKAFALRDDEWAEEEDTLSSFRAALKSLVRILDETPDLERTRLRNQADFYSLFGAVHEVGIELPEAKTVGQRLLEFLARVEDEEARSQDRAAADYHAAARSASNDEKPRRRRIEIIRAVILGEAPPTQG